MSNLRSSALLTELRSKDYDRYILCMFGTAQHRDDLAALFLLNAELARVRDQVSEPILGQIRLQWWHDGLKAAMGGTPPRHPVLDHLAIISRHGIDLAPLHGLIDARAHDLADHPFPDKAAYLHYMDATTRPLAQVAAAILGQKNTADEFTAALASYAEAIAPLSQDRIHSVPPETLIAHEKSRDSVLRHSLKAMPRPLRRAAAPLLLHHDLAVFYMNQQRRRKHNKTKPDFPGSRLRKLAYLLWRGFTAY